MLLRLAALAVLMFGVNLHVQADDQRVAIGDHVTTLEFKDIRYLPRSLSELGKHKAFVFVFTNTTCPLVQRYLPRLKSLHEEFGPLGVQFVAVNVGEGDSIQEMAAQALEHEMLFPFVKDRTGECARALGVERTPEVAVLNEKHRLVYRGRIDDQYRLGGVLPKPRQEELKAALQDILAARKVADTNGTAGLVARGYVMRRLRVRP
ncbi:MAG: redoxin family protein, partial [Planctomycetota bacterium]|nr:redoxin family protein [Planctomycetota bacterium]